MNNCIVEERDIHGDGWPSRHEVYRMAASVATGVSCPVVGCDQEIVRQGTWGERIACMTPEEGGCLCDGHTPETKRHRFVADGDKTLVRDECCERVAL